MAAKRTVILQGGSEATLTAFVTVRELTVAEVRDWATESAAAGHRDPVHAFALPDLGLDELARMTDSSAGELESFAPSELDELVAAAKSLNPHFFRLRSALEWATGQVMRAESPATSTEPSADSSASTGMPPS